jgi:transglutaminase-like putative cysteine protease
MIALCRLASLPARYVSGHMLGEGVMHAWVQVLLPTASGNAMWQPFDPLHARRTDLSYITVAVGRDYGDVSPTRGQFRAARPGWLATSFKQAGVLNVERVAS